MVEPVKIGDRVQIQYVGTLDDGSEFDSTAKHGGEPLEFIVGAHQVIPGFEDAVIGMQENETKKTHIPSDEAYGPKIEQLVQEVPLNVLPQDVKLEIGMVLAAQTMDGHQIPATIIKLTDTHATMDLNHPLAGQNLNFEITLEKIVERDIDVEKIIAEHEHHHHHHHDHDHDHDHGGSDGPIDVDLNGN